MNHDVRLILFTLVAVVALVVLIARFRMHPFIALMLVSLAVGFYSGMQPVAIAKAFQDGVGQTLGFLGIVVGLGIILGKMLAESGGARVIADPSRAFAAMLWRCPSGSTSSRGLAPATTRFRNAVADTTTSTTAPGAGGSRTRIRRRELSTS